ncbi:hypothetical protein ACX0G9_25910 [Flavitalea flava]
MSKNLLFFILGNVSLFALAYLTRKRKRLNNIILICTSLFFFLSIIETAYRNFFKTRQDYYEKVDNAVFFEPHSVLGYQISKTGVLSSSKLSYNGNSIYHANYTIIADSNINSFSFNHRAGYLNPGSPIPKVIFLGCSLTFGQGVNDHETLPDKLGALQGISTLNLGGVGYGLHHVYELFLDKYAKKNNENKIFIYTMIPDHVLRASGLYDWSPGPSFKLVGDSLVYGGSLPFVNNDIAYYSSFFGCYSFIKDKVTNIEEKRRAKKVSTEEYQKAYLMIRKMSQYSKETGGTFLLLFWDNISQEGDPNRYYRPILEDKITRLRKDSVHIIRVSGILDIKDPLYYILNDGHPNAKAYDTVARYLAKHLNF